MNESPPVTLESVLRVLAKDRLVQLGRSLDVAVAAEARALGLGAGKKKSGKKGKKKKGVHEGQAGLFSAPPPEESSAAPPPSADDELLPFLPFLPCPLSQRSRLLRSARERRSALLDP